MKSKVSLPVLLVCALVVTTYIVFTIPGGSCFQFTGGVSGAAGEHLLSEKVAAEDQRLSSTSTANKTGPVPAVAETRENREVRTDEESIRKGKDLYEKLCQKCHDAHTTHGTTGPGLRGILKNALLPSTKKPATGRNILAQLNNPVDKMPSFHFLSEEEKLSIIAFLNTL